MTRLFLINPSFDEFHLHVLSNLSAKSIESLQQLFEESDPPYLMQTFENEQDAEETIKVWQRYDFNVFLKYN